MRLLPALLFVFAFVPGCRAQAPSSNEISSNFIIPNPAPSAPMAQWVPASGRATVSLDLDGATLRGFRYSGADPKAPTLLFFNGNGMTIFRADPLYRQLAALGPTVVVYDYRGYGFSTGTPDLMTYRRDSLQLYDTVAASAPGHRVVVYGFSMGTAMASYIASERMIAALILAAPIGSAAEEYPIYGKLIGYSAEFIAAHKPSQESVALFGEAALIAKSRAPLLVLHGTDDFLIPVEQAREVLEASPSTVKRMVIIPDANHNATAEDPDSFAAVSQFLHSLN